MITRGTGSPAADRPKLVPLFAATLVIVSLLTPITVGSGVAASGNTGPWRLDSTAEWETGTFSGTDAWNGNLQVISNPAPAWTNSTVDDAMMVDVNDAVDSRNIVYSVRDDAIYMANQETGATRWFSADGQDGYADVARIGPRFVYSGDDHNVWVHDHEGTEVYNPTTELNISSSFVETAVPDATTDGVFYVGDEDNTIEAFNKTTGVNPGFSAFNSEVSSLYVDPSGEYLYANDNERTYVISGIPEERVLEASWSNPNGGIDDLDSDSVYADDQYFYFSGDDGNVSVVEKGTWRYLGNISATGEHVWSVDSDEHFVYYAAHDGFVYIHRKAAADGFPLVDRIDVGGGNRANSVDSDGQKIFFATDGGSVGAYDLITQNGSYQTTSLNWSESTTDDVMMVDVDDSINDTHFVYSVRTDAVYMANQRTGTVLWSSADGQDGYADMARIGPRFVYSGDDSNVWVHDHNGTEVYNPTTDGNISSSFVETAVPDSDPNGHFYVGDEDNTIEVFDKTTGVTPGFAGFSSEVSSLYVDRNGEYLYANDNERTYVLSGSPGEWVLEASWPLPNGGIDDLDSDSVYADGRFFYFSGDDGNVSVVEIDSWEYLGNISATGSDVWSVDSDEHYVYYAAHDGSVYVHKKSAAEGFPLVQTLNVGNGSRANSVDSDGEKVFFAADGGTVGAYDLYTQGGTYRNTRTWGRLNNHTNVVVDAAINSAVDLVVRADTDDDGRFENSTTIALEDGQHTYALDDLDPGYRTQIEIQFAVSPGEPTPVIRSLALNVPQVEDGVSTDIDSSTIETGDGDDGDTETGEEDQTQGEEDEQAEDQDEQDDASGETLTAVRTSQSEGQTQVSATVQNAQAGEPVEMQVSADGADPGGADVGTDGAQLTSVSVTPAIDSTFSLDITQSPEPLDTSPTFQLGDGTSPVSYLSVQHSIPNADIQEVTMTYRVGTETLDAMDSSPEDVSMFRYNGESWVEQPTQVVGTDDGTAILQTTAEDLSEWTAAAKRPLLNVTDTQVSVQAATTDEQVTIQVFVQNTGGTDGVYEAQLLLNDETVDRTERTVPDGGTVAVNFERTFGQPGLYEVQVNDVFVGQVNISAADQSVAVETAGAGDVQAQQAGNESGPAGDGGAGFPVLPVGVALVIVAGVGVWVYLTRVGD